MYVSTVDGTRCYPDPVSGRLIRKVDAESRHYRWWFEALHRIGFAASIRSRPLWDIVVSLLLTGVTLGAVTGVWTGARRLMR